MALSETVFKSHDSAPEGAVPWLFSIIIQNIRKDNCRTGILRAACIDSESNRFRALPHMANTHLREFLPIHRTLDAVIILSAAKPIPHSFYISRNGCGCPVRIPISVCGSVVIFHPITFFGQFSITLISMEQPFSPVFLLQFYYTFSCSNDKNTELQPL